ncbi:MAG TPA: hypothetical protein PLZ58_03995 [Candidatus Saccharibacteria bacterium]|nr:hypothetical protein [Candidatus Saccharibacteria bacterium]
MKSLKEVDWGKAPEGATHYNEYCICPWLKETPASYFAEDKGVWFRYSPDPSYYENHFNNAVKRPREWDGEGVPPIGTVCEYKCPEAKEWKKCEIVAHYFENAVAVDVSDCTAVCLLLGLFRPIKTPEQIAAEERLHAIDYMNDLLLGWGVEKRMLAVLYDAGYRKTEVKK